MPRTAWIAISIDRLQEVVHFDMERHGLYRRACFAFRLGYEKPSFGDDDFWRSSVARSLRSAGTTNNVASACLGRFLLQLIFIKTSISVLLCYC